MSLFSSLLNKPRYSDGTLVMVVVARNEGVFAGRVFVEVWVIIVIGNGAGWINNIPRTWLIGWIRAMGTLVALEGVTVTCIVSGVLKLMASWMTRGNSSKIFDAK